MPEHDNSMGEDAWRPEQLLADRYQVAECVRKSATSCLYRVRDEYRDCSCLALRPSLRTIAKPGGIEWFERFCQNALGVPPHPNLLACRRFDRNGDVPFLIMDDVVGKWWDAAIKQAELNKLPRMLDVCIQVAQGLAWLHANDRMHTNMKPANVMLADSGIVKILKYGGTDALTRVYASPEQIDGDRSLDYATDIWSWAASVLHMFVGKVAWPTGSKAPAALRRYVRSRPDRGGVALMPVPLVELLDSCFKSDPAARPLAMDDVVAQVEGIYQDVTHKEYRPPHEAASPPEPPEEAAPPATGDEIEPFDFEFELEDGTEPPPEGPP